MSFDSTKTYKESKYNLFIKVSCNKFFVYNSFTNSLVLLSNHEFNLVKDIISRPNKDLYGKKAIKYRNDLIQGGYLIENEFDEISVLKVKNRIGRFNNRFFGLTIAPTTKCNFDCTYCFENKSNITMNEETETHLMSFFNRKIKNVNSFGVSWFGGEPLIAHDIIRRLSSKFKQLCELNKVVMYPQTIITNGYLLTKSVVKELKEVSIEKAQITIDGPRLIHDKRRKLVNGSGTFSRILENVMHASEEMNIIIRINLDKTNIKYLDELKKQFDELGLLNKISHYYGRVFHVNNKCNDNSNVCFSSKQFSKILTLAERNKKDSKFVSYPNQREYGLCTADKINSFVVDPKGYLFKCWNEIGFSEKHSVGHVNIFEKTRNQHLNYVKYMSWEPFEKDKCLKCKYLPICGGGVPI